MSAAWQAEASATLIGLEPSRPKPAALSTRRRGFPGWRSSDGPAYSGAALGGNLQFWKPPIRAVDAEIALDGAALRARARDLERNHPFARQAVRTSRLGVVGKHLRYSCRPDHRFLGIDQDEAIKWAREWERIWEAYAHGPNAAIDSGRRWTFTELISLAHDSEFIDGEFVVVADWDPSRRWNTCFRLIDVDRLSNPRGAPETTKLRGGVELDDFGAAAAYHLRHIHPADLGVDTAADALKWARVPASTPWGRPVTMHGFDAQRPGQTRGRSEMASVISAMKMGAEYAETALASAILSSSYAAVLESQANHADALEAIGMSLDAADKLHAETTVELAQQQLEAALAYHEEADIRFSGAKIPKLYPGEKLNLLTPSSAAGSLNEFQGWATRSFAAGLGVDPIGVSQDYSNVNYSSAKMSQATTYRHYESKRARITRTLALRMVGCVLEEAVFSGAMWLPKGVEPADFYAAKDALIKGTFLSQGAPNLDPLKEAQALRERMALGLDTLQDAAAAEGKDYLDVMAQRAREMQELEELGLGEPAFEEAIAPPPPDPQGGAPEGASE